MIHMTAGKYSLIADSYFVTSTYSGMLEGLPSARTNQFILDQIPGSCERIFGASPLAILPAPLTRADEWSQRFGKDIWLLPGCWIAAQFRSEAIDPNFHGSTAIVCWFQNEAWPLVSDENAAKAAQLDWASFAVDFDY